MTIVADPIGSSRRSLTWPDESTLRVTVTAEAVAPQRPLSWPSCAAHPCLLFAGLVATGVRRDQHPTVMDLHQATIADDVYALAREPHPVARRHPQPPRLDRVAYALHLPPAR
jgi:hypothetical protein